MDYYKPQFTDDADAGTAKSVYAEPGWSVGMLRAYYQLAKPGIIYGNLMTATAGYLLASHWHVHALQAIGLLAGISLVIAAACVYNNVLDRSIDRRMQRTKQRALLTGVISPKVACLYATSMVGTGFVLLQATQNLLTLLLIAIAFVDYVVFYGYGKRHSVHGTLVGCIAGAIPLVVGYTAVTGKLDGGAALLFLVMVAWQMAHFFGIALYRLEDYRAARLPVMPAVYGTRSTRLQAISYIALFILAVLALGVFGYISSIAAGLLGIAGLAWAVRAVTQYNRLLPAAWGRQIFVSSLGVISVTSVVLSCGRWLG